MKMGTLLSILSLILCLNELMAGVSNDTALVGSNYTINCDFEVVYPSWTWKYNESYSEDITISGNSTIFPKFHAKERIEYDTNRKDLKLSNVTLGDAGYYLCSLAAQNQNRPKSSTLILDVDVLEVKDFECPTGGSGPFYVTTECVTPGAVNVEWFYEGNFGDIKIRHISAEKKEGDCSSGKAKITSRGLYTAHRILLVPISVHIKLKLSYLNDKELFKYCKEESYFIRASSNKLRMDTDIISMQIMQIHIM